MRSKRDTAWETAAKCAALAKEADDPQEREHYARMRDAWITLANRCEFIEFPDVTEKQRAGVTPERGLWSRPMNQQQHFLPALAAKSIRRS